MNTCGQAMMSRTATFASKPEDHKVWQACQKKRGNWARYDMTLYCSLGSVMAGGGIWCLGLLRRRATRAGWYIWARSKCLFTLSPPPSICVPKRDAPQPIFLSIILFCNWGGGDITCWCSLMTTSEGCSRASWYIRLDDTSAVEGDTQG